MKQNFIVVFCLITFWSTGICQENYFKRLPVQSETSSNTESCLISTKEGNADILLYFFRHNSDFNFYLKNIFLSVSNDNGINWSIPDSIDYTNVTEPDIKSIVTCTGRVLLTYKVASNPYYIRYSDDNGVLWSERDTLLNLSGTINTSLINLPGSRIGLIYTYGTMLRLMYSDDDGENWSESSLILNSVQIGRIMVSQSGEYFLTIKRPLDNNIYQLRSDDGVNWSAPLLLVQNATQLSRINCAINNSGHLIVAYEKEVATPFLGIFQKDIFQLISTDNGNSWSQPTLITKYKGNDFNHHISAMNDQFIISFSSNRNNLNDQLYYGFLLTDSDFKNTTCYL